MSAAAAAVQAPPKADRPEAVVQLPIGELRLEGNIREVGPHSVEELAASIRVQGILEPVLVARSGGGPPVLVAGFRRVAAAKMAGLRSVPAIIRELPPAQIFEVQLTENLQRADLTALEEAKAFQRYLGATKATQEQLARRIGKSQPYVANRIRLLGLAPPIRQALETGKISPSHGEVFLQLPAEATSHEVNELLSRQTREGLSTAQLTQRVKWKAVTIRDRVRRKKDRDDVVGRAKFPTCPAKDCGAKPNDLGYPIGSRFRCRSGHTWNPKTGELLKERRGTDPGLRTYREPPKPTLPVVDPDVPCGVDPGDLLAYLQLGGARIESLSVHPDRGGVRWDARGVRPLAGRLPGFTVGGNRAPKGKARMWEYESWNQSTDAQRRRAAEDRKILAEWLARLGKGKPGAAPAAAKSASKKRR